MYPSETYAAALELRRIGMDASWIARELAIPRGTVARWLRGGRQGRRPEPPRPLPPRPYAYLLGLYLGDGHISRGAHGQHVLSIACDGAYPGIVAAASAAIRALVPDRHVVLREHPRHRCTRVVCGSRWWPVLFPQHGPGRKHSRAIEHLDLLDIGWTQPNDCTIAIDRRPEVAKLDAFVGPKR